MRDYHAEITHIASTDMLVDYAHVEIPLCTYRATERAMGRESLDGHLAFRLGTVLAAPSADARIALHGPLDWAAYLADIGECETVECPLPAADVADADADAWEEATRVERRAIAQTRAEQASAELGMLLFGACGV